MKKPGRPSFHILPVRLASMRIEAKLTQLELTNKVYKLLGGPETEQRSRETHYQRVETSGKTSLKFADLISRVLAVPLGKAPAVVLAMLRGGAPDAPSDRIDEIQAQLQSQLDDGQNEDLRSALERYNDDDQPIRELAMHLATRIEIAHIEQRQDELNGLSKITGWTVNELLRPIGYFGHWMLVSRDLGGRDMEVVLGVSEVLYKIRVEGEKWLNAHNESDARVVLGVDGLWFRVSIEHPRMPQISLSFSFVRCTPSSSGFSWVMPTWRDRYWIDELESWAQSHANFVVGFNQVAMPQNLRKLRLVVTSRVVSELPAATLDERIFLTRLFVCKGSLDELPDEIFEKFRQVGGTHSLVTNWVSSDLWEELEPYLQEFPAPCWRITANSGGIRIEHEIRVADMLSRGMDLKKIPHPGTRFEITLAEELTDGQLQRVPWRAKDAEQVATLRLRKELQKRLDEIQIGPAKPRWLDRTKT